MPDVNLDNSDRRLIEGVVRLCRDNVSGWETNSEYNVPNVWPQSPPTDVDDEFPRGVVDIISSEDTELSVDLDVKLREVILRVTVFAESSGDVYDLTNDVDTALPEHWDSLDGNGEQYCGDWTFNSLDGSAETSESGETEGKLRYARYKDFVFETIRVN
jgi:hypothetical protein